MRFGGSFPPILRFEKLEILRSRWRRRSLTDAACPCDLLLLASGFSGCEAASLEACEAVRQAGIPVLTAGDMASGASLVVLAIASGKQAAARADASLMGYTNIL